MSRHPDQTQPVPAPPSAKSRGATIDDDDSPSNGPMKMVGMCRVQVTSGSTDSGHDRTSLFNGGCHELPRHAASGVRQPARDPRESADPGSRTLHAGSAGEGSSVHVYTAVLIYV